MNAPGSPPARAVEAVGLVRRFGDVEALRGASLHVMRGEIFGLVGPDGAGKTTTIRTLAGLLSRHGGEARILGLDPLKEGHRVRESLGVMPQRYSLYGDLSIAENLDFFGRLFCLPRATYAARAERLLAITRLAPFVDRRADALSGGMYKKLALACALLHEPSVLLLDEPTNGVDPVSRRELWELLYRFSSEGMAVLVSTPSMDEAERCHRVGLLHEGRMLCEAAPRDLISGFDHDVFELLGGDPVALERDVPRLDGVVASTFASARPRVVVRREGSDGLARHAGSQGASLRPAAPTFEDVFLARIAEAA